MESPWNEEGHLRHVFELIRYVSGPLPKSGALAPLIRKTEEVFGLFGVKVLSLSPEKDKLEYLPRWHLDEGTTDTSPGIYIPVDKSIGGLAVEA